MTEDLNEFTHIGLKKDTKRKVSILARIMNRKIFALIELWTNDAWELAKQSGLVNDKMLEPDAHWVGERE